MKYLIRDSQNDLQVIEVVGFKPDGVICLAPEGADADDGSCIDLFEEGTEGVYATINAPLKAAKDAAKAAAVTSMLAVQKGLAAQSFGRTLIAKVYALNEAKAAAGLLTAESFQVVLADETLKMIERLLINGSLKTAKTLIQGMGNTFFSSGERAAFVADIDLYLEQTS